MKLFVIEHKWICMSRWQSTVLGKGYLSYEDAKDFCLSELNKTQPNVSHSMKFKGKKSGVLTQFIIHEVTLE